MPVYEEMVKDKTGKMVNKLIDRQKVYYIRTYVTDEFGNKKQITRHNKNWIGIEGKREAIAEENRLINKKYNKYEKMTINELCDSYLEHIGSYIKLSSFKKYKDNINLYILPYFNNRVTLKITKSDIYKWHDYLMKKNFSIIFMQGIHITLVSVLNHGCSFYGLEKNVASSVGNFKIKNKEKKEMNFLTENEFNKFVEFETNIKYKCFFTILFYCGMRRGEVWCLKWEDIDFENKTINILKAYNPRNDKITSPKTPKSKRKIKVVQKVIDCILQLSNFKEDEFLFGIKSITATTLQTKCNTNCKKADIDKHIRIHDFRHSFASMCINKGVPIEIISQYLGHENISTTLDIYGHLYPNSQEKLVSILEN